MNYKSRERIAFWIDQAIMFSVALTSIWFASRIGYREAVRFARYEELRKARNQMRAVEHELALNEFAIRRALERWGSEDFDNIHFVVRAFERAKEADEIYLLDPDTTSALSEVYGDLLESTVAGIRKRGPSDTRYLAQDLYELLERIETARPLLEKDIDLLEREMKLVGKEDMSESVSPPHVSAEESSKEEGAAIVREASPLWEKGDRKPYTKRVPEMYRTSHSVVPAAPGGPVFVTWGANLPSGRQPARLWLLGFRKMPWKPPSGAEEDAEHLAQLCAGLARDPAFVLVHPISSKTGEFIDPNRPIGWRWLIVLVEDDAGERHPVREPVSWRIGEKPNVPQHVGKPSEKALVLPKGYLGSP